MILTIYVIDDEECIRDSLKWFLEDLGHEVITASAPSSCKVYQGHSCKKSLPCGDVLLIDYNMPGMNGLDFIEQLSARGCKGITSNMLLMSGNTRVIDLDKANKLGCKVMQKPIPFNFLQSWLEDVKNKLSSQNSNS